MLFGGEKVATMVIKHTPTHLQPRTVHGPGHAVHLLCHFIPSVYNGTCTWKVSATALCGTGSLQLKETSYKEQAP